MAKNILFFPAANFVVTLETKPARASEASNFTYVRVYLNWDKQASPRPSSTATHAGDTFKEGTGEPCSSPSPPKTMIADDEVECPPMRARIAGRVTPSGQSAGRDALEMIEIPLKKPATFVNVCQSSCNIIVSSGMSLSVFKFDKKILDTPRLEFIDFDEIMEIDVGFPVLEVSILEDVVGCVSEREAHVFQIVTNNAYNNVNARVGNGGKNPIIKSQGLSVLRENDTWRPYNYDCTSNEESSRNNSRGSTQSRSRSRSKSRSKSRSPGRFCGSDDQTKTKILGFRDVSNLTLQIVS